MDATILTLSAVIVIACSASPAPVASSGDAPRHAACSREIGASAPLATCTTTAPCTHPLPLVGRAPITSPSNAPRCATSRSDHPSFDDGPPVAFTPADGVARYACVFRPTGASPRSPRPLVVFLHGSGGSAQNVYDFTLLRAKAQTYDLTGDPMRPGFHLVAIGARNLHWPSPNPQDGPKHDFYDRDLRSPSSFHSSTEW